MKRCLIVILLCALLPASTAFAQLPNDPATKEDVQKLFEVMHSRKQFESLIVVFKQQLPALTQSIRSKQLPNATPEETAKLNSYVDSLTDTMFNKLPYDELMQALMPAYQHHFTHQEVEEITRFYSSAVGQKTLSEMPAVMNEYMTAARPVMQKWMEARMVQIKADAEQYAKSLKNETAPTKSTPKTKPTS
jgi:hypothetical protein